MKIIIKQLKDEFVYIKIDTKQLTFEQAQDAKQTVIETIENDSKKINLDLSSIVFMDSIGLGLIVSIYRYVHKVGGEMRLCSLAKQPNELISMLGLDQLLTLLSCQDCLIEYGECK